MEDKVAWIWWNKTLQKAIERVCEAKGCFRYFYDLINDLVCLEDLLLSFSDYEAHTVAFWSFVD